MLHNLWMFVVGIVGSVVGGYIARLFDGPAPGAPVYPAGMIMSAVGALIALFLYSKFVG